MAWMVAGLLDMLSLRKGGLQDFRSSASRTAARGLPKKGIENIYFLLEIHVFHRISEKISEI